MKGIYPLKSLRFQRTRKRKVRIVAKVFILAVVLIGSFLDVERETMGSGFTGSIAIKERNFSTLKAQMNTVQVPQDFDSIQAAIDAVSSGGVVQIKPGLYEENLLINKSLTLIKDGFDSIVIKSKPTAPAITIENAGTVNLQGINFFPITQNLVQQKGIVAIGETELTIRFSKFFEFALSLEIKSGANASIQNVDIVSVGILSADEERISGIRFENAEGRIENSRIYLTTDAEYSNGVFSKESTISIENNAITLFQGNSEIHSALFLVDSKGIVMANDISTQNATGITISGSLGLEIFDNIISTDLGPFTISQSNSGPGPLEIRDN